MGGIYKYDTEGEGGVSVVGSHGAESEPGSQAAKQAGRGRGRGRGYTRVERARDRDWERERERERDSE